MSGVCPKRGKSRISFDGSGWWRSRPAPFSALRKKLERMPHYPVTVVILPRAKRLIWVEEDGTLSDPHPSPKKGSAMDAFDQLVYLAPLLGHPRLTVRLVLLDLDEYRRRTAGAGTANVAHRLETGTPQ